MAQLFSQSIDIHNIDEGVDRKQLKLIKQRFIDLNQQRYQRTSAALSERQQQFLALLPLLFHVNHPMLPGYFSHQTPSGVYNYTPDRDTLRLAKIWARSFTYQKDLVTRQSHIDSIFVMGSVGTIAQSESSDLDIWVCHDPRLNQEAKRSLQQKCQRLSQWAEQTIHLEAHFFLMSAEDFRAQKTAALTSEASGSAQHYLLLDEFYRTALWLAGKVPLWWFVPATQESHYDDFTQTLLSKRFLQSEEVIDFGGIPCIPRNEFIGAGIWQVYKGIEAPYKSVLKLLLLETYARDADAEPLALEFKRQVFTREPEANLLDTYVMIYQRIEEYLLRHGQTQRLELVRRCFYFKVDKPLTRGSRGPQKSWQRLLLESMVAEWNWPNYLLITLDNRPHWQAPQVIAERTLLVNELSNSYRLLSELQKNNFAEAAISSEELMILGRKLHAAFERKAGKIEWINPGISRDLHEASLCVIQEKDGDQDRWLMYQGSLQEFNLRPTPAEPIKRARHLLELLLWAYCNGILTLDTRLDIQSELVQLNSTQIQQLVQCFYQWLPLPLPPLEHNQFKQTAQVTQLLLLFNLGVEPQAELQKKGMQRLSNQRDALGYSGLRENLVLTADLVQINSWQEVVHRHYGRDALLNALLHYLRMLPPGQGLTLPQLTIRCFSQQQGTTITQRLEELWRDIIACYYSGTRPGNTRYIIQSGDEYLLLQFLQQQPHITRYKNYATLLEKLGKAQTEYSPIVVDRYALRDQPLKLICGQGSLPGVYVFYRLMDKDRSRAEVSLLDEKGSLLVVEMPFHNTQTLLRPLLRFIRSVVERQTLHGDLQLQQRMMQNLQFFEILGNVSQQQGYVEGRQVSADIHQLPFINIQAIGEPDDYGNINYNLFCDGEEFLAIELGQQVYERAAQYILRHRGQRERYPCYITDLDLSLCRELIAPQTGLQLSHYFQAKASIEQKLNQALHKL